MSTLLSLFTRGPLGDALDIRDVLSGYGADPVAAHFVLLETVSGNTRVSVDADGLAIGASFTPLVTLQSVTGLNLDKLIADGNLIVS